MTANQRWQIKWLTCRPPHASTNGDRTSRRNGQVVNVAVNHCLDCECRLRCCSEKWRCWRPSCVAIVWAHYNWIPWYLRAVFTLFPVSTTKLPTDSPGCHITQDFDCTTFLSLVLTVIRQFTFFFLSGWSASFFFLFPGGETLSPFLSIAFPPHIFLTSYFKKVFKFLFWGVRILLTKHVLWLPPGLLILLCAWDVEIHPRRKDGRKARGFWVFKKINCCEMNPLRRFWPRETRLSGCCNCVRRAERQPDDLGLVLTNKRKLVWSFKKAALFSVCAVATHPDCCLLFIIFLNPSVLHATTFCAVQFYWTEM